MIKTITLDLPSRISTLAQINNPMNCSRKIRIVKMQRAPMAFCANGRGMLYDPDEAILDDAGELNDVDVELMVLVRSSVSVPGSAGDVGGRHQLLLNSEAPFQKPILYSAACQNLPVKSISQVIDISYT